MDFSSGAQFSTGDVNHANVSVCCSHMFVFDWRQRRRRLRTRAAHYSRSLINNLENCYLFTIAPALCNTHNRPILFFFYSFLSFSDFYVCSAPAYCIRVTECGGRERREIVNYVVQVFFFFFILYTPSIIERDVSVVRTGKRDDIYFPPRQREKDQRTEKRKGDYSHIHIIQLEQQQI